MKSLRQCLADAGEKRVAVGHFNVSNVEMIWGVFRAARALELPVIIGVSEGERDFIGVRQAVALIKSLREEYDYPIFINADHTYSEQRVMEAVDAGYDAVIFDGVSMSFEENLKVTKKCVDYARSKNPEMIVEGELGFIGKSSKVWEAIPEGVKITEEYLTKPEEAARFAKETGIDLLAPAVGNIHGMLNGGKDPALNLARVREIREAAKIPLVLHGASGNSDEDIRGAVEAGAVIVHVSTEIRVAYRQAIGLALQEDPDEVAPYKYLKSAVGAVSKVVTDKLKVFNGIN